MITQILLNTPIWVYILFVFLLYLGIKSCFKTQNNITAMLVLPIVFLVWSLVYFFSKIPLEFGSIGIWIGGVFLGFLTGWLIVRHHSVFVEKEKRRLHLPGSPIILIIILVFFSFRYYVGVTIAIHPEQLQNAAFVAMMLGVSSFALGILLGRTSNYLSRIKTGPKPIK